jgi:hypothetical protein
MQTVKEKLAEAKLRDEEEVDPFDTVDEDEEELEINEATVEDD